MIEMFSQDQIQQIFDCELLSLLPQMGLSQTDVAWPNVAFNPHPDKGYLRPFLLPAASHQATLGFPCFVRLNGVYQIDVCTLKGDGLETSRTWKSLLLSAFHIGRVLKASHAGSDSNIDRLTITINSAYDGAMQEDKHRAVTPISVFYSCYAPQHPAKG